MTPLNEQKAWTGEIGSRGRWDRFTWDVTFYHSELQDELLKFNTDPGAGIPATTFNAKHTMHQGVEFRRQRRTAARHRRARRRAQIDAGLDLE